MKSTAKDIILLCKGWYDKEKYSTILDALKGYYRKYYVSEIEDEILTESFLLNILLNQTMWEISKFYPDRFINFTSQYMFGENLSIKLTLPEEKNKDYEYQLFYRIVAFLHNLNMHGETLENIDTREYFYEKYDEGTNTFHKELLNDII